jgi:hypothetical protein
MSFQMLPDHAPQRTAALLGSGRLPENLHRDYRNSLAFSDAVDELGRIAMAWEILWFEGTREQLEVLAREQFAKIPMKQDFGQLTVQKVEQEIRLHPLPSRDLPQVRGEQSLRLGRIQVAYYIDTETAQAEVRKVTLL